jgi:cell division protein FtsW (lipid II flippase)
VVHSDFIFAAIGEEWGLIGVLCLIVCLAVLIMRGLHIAALWSDDVPFRMLLAAGLSILLAIQSP